MLHAGKVRRVRGYSRFSGFFLSLFFVAAIASVLSADLKSEALQARKELAKLHVASNAFRLVAAALKPSVVSIRTAKIISVASSGGPEVPWFGQNDPLLRRFFGEDFFERFFGIRPHGGQVYRQTGIGTGVIVDEKGYIVTNNHVVEGADEITVQLADKREFTLTGEELKKRVWTDPKSDLAVLKIDADNLVPAKWGDSDKLAVGDWVVAIGNPFGLDLTVTVGICSAKGRALANLAEYQDFIQTDAAINPGNSGGPLANLKGEVIGINTAIFSRTGGYMGIGFAIPSNMARNIMERLIKYGKIRRGYLGVYVQDLTPDLAKTLGLEEVKGVVVPKVVPGSPAEKAGIKQGDVILEVNGKAIESGQQLKNLISSLNVGDVIEIKVKRGGKILTFKAEIAEADSDGSKESLYDVYGFDVEDLTPDVARALGYRQVEGVVITRVKPGSPADRAGLRRNEIIVSVQNRNINSVDEFLSVVRQVDPSRGLLLLVRNPYGMRFVAVRKP